MPVLTTRRKPAGEPFAWPVPSSPEAGSRVLAPHSGDATGIGGAGALRYWITSSAVASSVSGMVRPSVTRSYSISSSAWMRTPSGSSRPSALAVVVLITSSNLVAN